LRAIGTEGPREWARLTEDRGARKDGGRDDGEEEGKLGSSYAMPQAASWMGSPSIKGRTESMRMALLTFSLVGMSCVFPSLSYLYISLR
jgi:hypothetical protein